MLNKHDRQQRSKEALQTIMSRISSATVNEFNSQSKEGIQNFQNQIAQLLLKQYEIDGDDDEKVTKQFRNSIYNFNRKGCPKSKIRLKFFESEIGEFDENRRGAGKMPPFMYLPEEDQEAFIKYQQTMDEVDQIINKKKTQQKYDVSIQMGNSFNSTLSPTRYGQFTKLSKKELAEMRDKGEVVAAGQLLGHQVQFKGMQHATSTMMKIRQHNIQRQQLHQKQEIRRIADAMEKQLIENKRATQAFNSLDRKPNKTDRRSRANPLQGGRFEEKLVTRSIFNKNINNGSIYSPQASRPNLHSMNTTLVNPLSDGDLLGGDSDRKSSPQPFHLRSVQEKYIQPIIQGGRAQIINKMKQIPIKFSKDTEGSRDKYIGKLRQAQHAITRIRGMQGPDGLKSLVRSPEPIIQGQLLQQTMLRRNSRENSIGEELKHQLNTSFEKFNSKVCHLPQYSSINNTIQTSIITKPSMKIGPSPKEQAFNQSVNFSTSGKFRQSYGNTYNNGMLSKGIGSLQELPLIDASYQYKSSTSLERFNTVDENPTMQSVLHQDASLVNFQDAGLNISETLASKERLFTEPHGKEESKELNIIDQLEDSNSQHTISQLLDGRKLQMARNIDNTFSLRATLQGSKFRKGKYEVPNIKVKKKQDENIRIDKIIEFLKPRQFKHAKVRDKSKAIGGTIMEEADECDSHANQDKGMKSTCASNLRVIGGQKSPVSEEKSTCNDAKDQKGKQDKRCAQRVFSERHKVQGESSLTRAHAPSTLTRNASQMEQTQTQLGSAAMQHAIDYEAQKQVEDILGILKNFSTLGEINAQYGEIESSRVKAGGGEGDHHDEDVRAAQEATGKKQQMIPHNKRYFERFFEIKQEIKQKFQREMEKKAREQKEEGKADITDLVFSAQSSEVEYVYNIKTDTDERIKLFVGEGGRFVQTNYHDACYQGGFMGSQFNYKVGSFKIVHNAPSDRCKIEYLANADASSLIMARMGHLAFCDHESGVLILFAGSKSGDKYKQGAQRLLTNDIVIYDVKKRELLENIQFSEGTVQSRMYHCGFKIGTKIYSFGGMGTTGQLLDKLTEIDYKTKRPAEALVERGKHLLEGIHSSAIAPVFYQSKMDGFDGAGDLKLSSIVGDIDWGKATDLIRHEGFYLFGGKTQGNSASNTFLIFKIEDNKRAGRTVFRVFKPKTLGQTPTARYMHSFNYMATLGIVILHGGRNDALPAEQILSDVHILKLHNLEWVRAQVGGYHCPIPRANHAAFVSQTELIVCGGQGRDFLLQKDIISMQFDQDSVDRFNPILKKMQMGLQNTLSRVKLEQKQKKVEEIRSKYNPKFGARLGDKAGKNKKANDRDETHESSKANN